jgi:acyl dehydratase
MDNIFYEDFEIGDQLGPAEVIIERRNIVKFVQNASLNYKRFTDDDFAKKEGLGGAIVPGTYSLSLLAKMVTDSFGPAVIMKLGVNFRGLIHHRDVITCGGMVANKKIEGDEHLLECDVYLENQDGEKPIKGQAIVRLPSKDNG